MSKPTLRATDLLEKSGAELDTLYRQSEPGAIPVGEGKGTVILAPRSALGKVIAFLARLLVWKGKVFIPAEQNLLNRIAPIGLKAIRANVYVGDSWVDGGKAIILDYSKTSIVARKIRDEIREVSPGIYLGYAYWGRRRVLGFALTFGDN